ncbi:glycoside hydrolase family 95 protein [Microbulbifer agarilyticus]|uniref:glycoside hydrolase family 95 protein n=1 Tax=Microbulbifer agarilyticus TaxID=260552 RepID=UPI001CD65CBB|nr:glycoside hydrolase family 95 protein [Microbulbifer agarilyticus]MCA0900791.1 glycoside hydrolase family 95 protein [Microbulbifer agarilyticus]
MSTASKRNVLSLIAAFLLSPNIAVSESAEHDPAHAIWFEQPALNWDQALPIGNGRLGAMVFGGIGHERLQLNEDSMWAGQPTDRFNRGSKVKLDAYRESLFNGDHASVEQGIMRELSINQTPVRSHQTLGDLFLTFDHAEASHFHRALDLKTAVASVSYMHDGVRFQRQTFSSQPDQILVSRLTASEPGALSFTLRLSRPEDNGIPTATTRVVGSNTLVQSGQVTQVGGIDPNDGAGVRFFNQVTVVPIGGVLKKLGKDLRVENADSVIIYIAANTDFYTPDYVDRTRAQINAAINKGWKALKRAHIEDYQALYHRSVLTLEETENTSLPTDMRLQGVQQGAPDPAFSALYYHYGRYLLISSSRVGSQPANLQGIWNRHIRAPWNADYHLNINLQMNYWPADLVNLSELQRPLFEFIKRLAVRGRKRARENFGARGWVSPHATDIWADVWTRAARPYWGLSHNSNAWLVSHLVESYRFSGDEAFLRDEVYPLLREVCEFYFDWLVPHPQNGLLVSGPAVSPENRFLVEEGGELVERSTTMGPAMDQQVIGQLFKSTLEVLDHLAISNEFSEELEHKYRQLSPGIRLDENGRIMEWFYPYREAEPGHRHISHLYALYPGSEIHPLLTPEFADAARKTIEHRLEHGGAATGWSRAWMINFMARLHDGETAKHHLDVLYQRSTSSNLFDLHPPFQIDGNFGATAAIVEMLLQSHAGYIDLLPALPRDWASGAVRGIKARSGYEVGVRWRNGQLAHSTLRAREDGLCRVRYQGRELVITDEQGREVAASKNEYGIFIFDAHAETEYQLTTKI